MPVAVVFLLRAVVLVLLWGFVIAAVVAVRHDVFGTTPRPARVPAPPATKPPAVAKPVQPVKAPKPVKPPRSRKAPAVATQVVVLSGPSAGTTVTLSSLPVTIGRDANSTIVLADDYVSSRHARLVPHGTEWLIEDTGSTNGTRLGEVLVTTPTVVPVGGQIRIGHNLLELRA